MGVLNWGKPKIEISKLDESGQPTKPWKVVDNPVKDSTNLETTEGETTEAEGEGDELVDIKVGKSRYKFSWENYKKQGVEPPVEDIDGKVEGFYAMRLTPEDANLDGIKFAKSVVTCTDTFTAKDGQKKKYTMNVLTADTGKTILPYTKEDRATDAG